MTDTEHLLDNLLNDVVAGKRTPAECLAFCEQRFPELTASLELALALHRWSPGEAQIGSAQRNVWQSIEAALDEECECPDMQAPRVISSVERRVISLAAQRQFRRWLPVAVCAAMLAILLMGAWTLTAASADALPGSPLYGVKRADENFQLRVAWSSQMRSQTLAQIALRRLTEARAEAARHNTSQALALMKECNEATGQLIDLAISVRSQHQDDAAVQQALATTLRAEYDALNQATSDGQVALAQALSANVSTQQQVLNANNIPTPPAAAPVIPTPSVATHSTPSSHATPATPAHPAHPTPGAQPTQGAHPTPNAGNGGGNGNGNGNGNGQSNSQSNSSDTSHGNGGVNGKSGQN